MAQRSRANLLFVFLRRSSRGQEPFAPRGRAVCGHDTRYCQAALMSIGGEKSLGKELGWYERDRDRTAGYRPLDSGGTAGNYRGAGEVSIATVQQPAADVM